MYWEVRMLYPKVIADGDVILATAYTVVIPGIAMG